jgi:ribonucleoside-diphosphate reductase alpha chain
MDYIFRWLEIRFVSGQQFPLFPQLGAGATGNQQLASGQGAVVQGAVPVNLPPVELTETTPPQGGVVSDLAKGQELRAKGSIEDRGLYHSADALKEIVDLGDAPSCHLCGAIMTRNGSCYRCMSCGSTSGCS